MLDFLGYLGQLILLTLGTFVACGFAAWLAERLFVRMAGSTKFVYVSSVIGTPIHELGHAIMCLLFGHKITEMRLLLPPNHPSGTLGYVQHSYNPRNPWARLGNLFIGIGPIFSGMGVMILMLFLCFPEQWGDYVATSSALSLGESSFGDVVSGVFSLLLSLPAAFADKWWAALIGIIVILAVSQHVTLSGADIKGALSSLLIYLPLLLIFAIVTALCGVQEAILSGLWIANLWMLSLFAIAIAFSLVWILIALVILLCRLIRKAF
ncbi:MAG: hypothetical protein IJW30_06780 [Clostridia bacterium]|nr:hypothetical protein [Clostridia bacterium]MBQ9774354.1 hypothetical protein [Clostridia bacterium]